MTIERSAALLVLGALLIAGPAFGDADCTYKGATYSDGSGVCQSGSQYRCDDGRWQALSIACAEHPSGTLNGCALNGTSYFPGSVSCQSNTEYRCIDGAWASLGLTCVHAAEVAAHRAPAGLTCMYDGTTVATESTICKAGVAFRCDDGTWSNLGTACQ